MFIQFITHAMCAFQAVLARYASTSIAYWQYFKRIRAQGGLLEHLAGQAAFLNQFKQLAGAKRHAKKLNKGLRLRLNKALVDITTNRLLVAKLSRDFTLLQNTHELLQTDAGEAIYKYDFIRSELQTLEVHYENMKSELAQVKETLANSVNLSQSLHDIKRAWLKKKINELRQRCLYHFDDDQIRGEVLMLINEHRSEFTAIDIETIKAQSLCLFVENWQSFDEMERLRSLRVNVRH